MFKLNFKWYKIHIKCFLSKLHLLSYMHTCIAMFVCLNIDCELVSTIDCPECDVCDCEECVNENDNQGKCHFHIRPQYFSYACSWLFSVDACVGMFYLIILLCYAIYPWVILHEHHRTVECLAMLLVPWEGSWYDMWRESYELFY